jgi:hypothetical protein
MRLLRNLGLFVAFSLLGLAAWPAAGGAAADSAIVHTSSFAGYEFGANAATASADFTLPSIGTCTSTNTGVDAFLGLNNFSTEDFTSGGISMGCQGGNVFYEAYTEINNDYSYSPEQLGAGDAVEVVLTTSSTSSSVTVEDSTNHSSTTNSVSGPGGGGTFTTVSVGDGAITKAAPPQFGGIAFTGININGAKAGNAGPSTRYEWFVKKVLTVETSTISGKDSFTTTQV